MHHRHHQKRPPPSYHWEGFGRKNTKPPWFDCRLYDKDRRDVAWVIKDFGPPSAVNKPGREGAAPFVHDPDSRIYRPTVPAIVAGGSLGVEVPATPSSRMLVPRGSEFDGGGKDMPGVGGGIKNKLALLREEASRHSHLQMLANMEVSRRSELRETICGRGRTIKKALIYPQTVTHQQALNLEKRTGPGLAYDAPQVARAAAAAAAAAAVDPHPWNQHMYLPRYSRTRADFPGLSRNRSSPASLPSALQ
ncbi:unnamed protein product [Pylaiella littoralis]